MFIFLESGTSQEISWRPLGNGMVRRDRPTSTQTACQCLNRELDLLGHRFVQEQHLRSESQAVADIDAKPSAWSDSSRIVHCTPSTIQRLGVAVQGVRKYQLVRRYVQRL